jgi:hypothetical protein
MAAFNVAFNFQPDTVVGFPHDVTAFVRSLSINRGTSVEAVYPTRYQAGTASVVLDNSDGRFDPFNLGGTYVADGATLIVPMRPMIQISVDDGNGSDLQPIFTGFVDRWIPTYPATGKDAVTSAECVDGIARLAAVDRAAVAPTGTDDPTSDRVDRILDSAGWSATDRDIAPDTGFTQAILDSTTLAGNPWAELQLTADSEPGEIFVSKAGDVTFLDKATLFSSGTAASAHTFTDATPPTNGFRDVALASDATLVANDIRITSADNEEATASDLTSIDLVGIRSYVREDLLFIDSADPGVTQEYADFILSVLKDAKPRIETLTFMPASDTANLWDQVKLRELGHRITVAFTPLGSDPIERRCIIRGISHTCGPGFTSSWITTFRLQDAAALTPLIFDDAYAGRFDFGRFGIP